jgi:hypothetical protein
MAEQLVTLCLAGKWESVIRRLTAGSVTPAELNSPSAESWCHPLRERCAFIHASASALLML